MQQSSNACDLNSMHCRGRDSRGVEIETTRLVAATGTASGSSSLVCMPHMVLFCSICRGEVIASNKGDHSFENGNARVPKPFVPYI